MTLSGIILSVVLAALSPAERDAAHNGPLNMPCVECHARLPLRDNGPSLREGVDATCMTCHPRPHGAGAAQAHPLDRVPSLPVPPDMPLDSRGRIVCTTCHAFHGAYRDEDGRKRYYLRRMPGKTFCLSCHKKIPGMTR